jgi:hypothetical protein
VQGVEKPGEEEPSEQRLFAWVVRHPSCPYGSIFQAVPKTGIIHASEMKHGNANATTGGAQECLFWVPQNKGDVGTLRAETNDQRGRCTAIRRREERMFTTCLSRQYRSAGESRPNSGQRDAYSTRAGTRRIRCVVSSASRYRVKGLRIYRDLVLEPDVPEPVVPLPVLLPEPVVPEPLLPEPIVPVPEPVVPLPVLLPEPVVPVSEPVVPLPVLLPEPVIPEPLLPEPVGPGSVSPDLGLG